MSAKPLVLDLFCGLWGWTEGFLAHGWQSIGIDLKIPKTIPNGARFAQYDILQLTPKHIKQLSPDFIVASPPCQTYSYMAMPWSRARKLAIWYQEKQERIEELNALFNHCFRIQEWASEAKGKHVPMIVENVVGAQKWVGKAKGHYGSFYLWGDVIELPKITRAAKVPGQDWNRFNKTGEVSPHWRMEAQKVGIYSDPRRNGGKGAHLTSAEENLKRLYADRDSQGIKQHGSGHIWYRTGNGALPSKSIRREEASAMIAKIPQPLSSYLASCALQMI